MTNNLQRNWLDSGLESSYSSYYSVSPQEGSIDAPTTPLTLSKVKPLSICLERFIFVRIFCTHDTETLYIT